jgi:hypothetical protein
MPIPALLAPLLSQGLSLIGNAVLAKGKDWVEEKTGVKLDQPLSAEDTVRLRQYEMDHEEELLRLRIEEKKLGIDMTSDSTLSKNIRPMTLIYILTAYLVFAGLSAAGIQVQEAYVSLLGQWGMLVMTAYFGGRTVEKVMEMRKGGSK